MAYGHPKPLQAMVAIRLRRWRSRLSPNRHSRQRTGDAVRGLYVIVDTALTGGRAPLWVAEQALNGGATAIQLRDKHQARGDLLDLAYALRDLCRNRGATFIVNDHVDLAAAVGAHGVHLGQRDLPIRVARRLLQAWQIVGTSNALVEEAMDSYHEGADYIAVGAMFGSGSKADTRPAGLETMQRVRTLIPEGGPPLVAIGGITAANAQGIAEAGADGICVIGAVAMAEEPAQASRELLAAFRTAAHG